MPKDPDSPSPGSSPLSSLTSSARRRLPGLSASSSCGLTSRRTTFRTLRTSSSSTPTRRWPRSSALTSHRHWTFFPNNFHFHPFTKFIYNSSNSTPHISKNGRQRTYGDVSETTDFTPNCCGCRRYYSLPPSAALNKKNQALKANED